MGKLLKLNESKINFKVVVANYSRENENTIYKRALIVIINSENGKTVVHSFSEFILKKYRNNSIKTQVDYSNKIVKFLNFIKNNSNKKNFCFLDFEDIRAFLQYIALKANKDTVSLYKRILIMFYEYLSKKNFLVYITSDDFYYEEKYVSNYKKLILKADIDEIDLIKDENKSRNTHSMSYALQALFLEIAFEEVNIIALGIAFQMFGGLRTGEIINLSYSAIQTVGKYGRYGLILDVRNRDFRNNISLNQGKGYVKRTRYQQVFSPFNIIEPLFKNHTRKYKNHSNSGAIFINSNGEAMSYESYMYYFRKLKEIFIKRLQESDDPKIKIQGIILMSRKWGSHIGRGIFTNNFSNIINNPSQLQNIRGDKHIESANIYIDDSDILGKKLEENSELAFKNLISKL